MQMNSTVFNRERLAIATRATRPRGCKSIAPSQRGSVKCRLAVDETLAFCKQIRPSRPSAIYDSARDGKEGGEAGSTGEETSGSPGCAVRGMPGLAPLEGPSFRQGGVLPARDSRCGSFAVCEIEKNGRPRVMIRPMTQDGRSGTVEWQ